MTPKIKKLREKYYQEFIAPSKIKNIENLGSVESCYCAGFDAAWREHERLVGPLIEALNKEHMVLSNNAIRALLEYKSEVEGE